MPVVKDRVLEDLEGRPIQVAVDGATKDLRLFELLRYRIASLPVQTAEDARVGARVVRALVRALREGKDEVELEREELDWVRARLPLMQLSVELFASVDGALRGEG